MYINGKTLLSYAPIKDMLTTKETNGIVSHGLSELGYDIRIAEELVFNPYNNGIYRNGHFHMGRFILASSIEYFQIPSFLGGEVKDKSSWARKGVQVYNTVIEPGWKGYLTIEINFHGNQHVHIPAGSGIAQVLFMKTAEDAFYEGKYQRQEAGPQESRNG